MSVIDLKLKTYDELTFEIAQLNTDKYLLEQKLKQKENIIKGLDNTIQNLEEVMEHKDNIIKEAREYLINTNYDSDLPKLMEILEKEK